MKLLNFMPARQDQRPVVADLDALLSEDVAFRWNGKVHTIRRMDLKTYLGILRKYAHILELKDKEKVDEIQLINDYGDFFSEACPTIGREEVKRMTLPQVGALAQLILQSVTGEAQAKKKMMEAQNPQQV